VLVFDSCSSGAKALLDSGYRVVDIMTVLVSSGAIARKRGAEVTVVPASLPEPWARTYLNAFYGDDELAEVVIPIVNRLLKVRAVTLLEAVIGDSVAGCLAIFRTEGIAGVYCVGTAHGFRKMGVATELLARAREIAEAERRTLILQTLASDKAGPFYSQRGFESAYSKKIMEKES
jgi:GNAT superfamily N-acetyltransferase